MKIAVISTCVFKLGPTGAIGYSGLEHLAWQQAAGLAARGHEVTLMAPDGSVCPGVTIFPMGPAGTWDERITYQKYWKELTKQSCVIDDSWNKWSLVLKQEGVLKAPVLGVLHAPVNTMYQTLPPIEKPCFVCISEDQANHFRALFNADCRVCHNGIDLDWYEPLDVPRSSRYLFLARFSTIKGPDLAIAACKQAGVGLDLVGDTSITNEPEYLHQCKMACDEGDALFKDSFQNGKLRRHCPTIRMVGPASRSECVWWFSQAHCLLHPNQRFCEPLGLSPLESQACGTPVIAWDYGAMRETVKHGETGFLVKSLPEMVGLIENNAVAALDRRRCREWVADNFSVQRMVARYEQLCIEAVEGGW